MAVAFGLRWWVQGAVVKVGACERWVELEWLV